MPRKRFAVGLVAPAAVVFCLAVALMGAFADPDTFSPRPLKDAIGVVELPSSLQGLSRGGLNHWRTILYFGTHVPEVCWGDNAVNDFQRRQCGEFWEKLGLGAALGLAPLAMTALFWFVALGSLDSLYRSARRQIESGRATAKAVVTSPAEAPGDLFSRVYCLRAIGAQMPSGKQIKVYMPLDAPAPLPGQTVALFGPSVVLGELRYFAVIYAPHVVVVAGVRRA